MNKELNIAIIGDSISAGLGNKQYNYVEELKSNLKEMYDIECKIFNFSKSGKTIRFANEMINDINSCNPDVLISFIGNVDGQIRPKTNSLLWKILPSRYKKIGMTDPRPYYSKKKIKAIVQRFDSFIRVSIKFLLIRVSGTHSWVELNEFKKQYKNFIGNVQIDCKKILVSTVYIDEFYFPGSNKSYDMYNKVIEILSDEQNCYFLDIRLSQKQQGWNLIYADDHFHPSKEGYRWYGKIFAQKIGEIYYPNKV